MSTKAAIVIGVDQTGGLDRLHCAADNAVEVGAWLKREGYRVRVLTDAKRPLHARRVERAFEDFVTIPVRFNLLVVYFSGHGSWHARSDRWLLSGAPTQASDAINLGGAMDLARCSGIKTVVFISDACRTIPTDAAGQRVEGVDAFPNLDLSPPSKVDVFKATSETRSAYEATIPAAQGARRVSILTEAWRTAYEEATPAMVLEVTEKGKKVGVVPNRKLELYLQPKVDQLLAIVDPTIVQTLEINVPSADDVYISKVHGGGAPPPTFGPPFSPPTMLSDAVGEEIVENLLAARADAPLLERDVEPLFPNLVESYESKCGLAVYGAQVASAESTGRRAGIRTEFVDDNAKFRIRVWEVTSAASVAVLLEDGRSFVLPVFAGYIGHVFVDEQGVTSVSYVPSSNSQRFDAYLERRDEIDRLRAQVARSVDRGQFRVSREQAPRLADAIRIDKALDPSLGLYAAHAYSNAGLDDQVNDILMYMREDLATSMFDVVMLASRQIDRSRWPSVPFCPMLTQAWNLLRPRGFELHPFLYEMRAFLQDSLWTTFGAGRGPELIETVVRGDFG